MAVLLRGWPKPKMRPSHPSGAAGGPQAARTATKQAEPGRSHTARESGNRAERQHVTLQPSGRIGRNSTACEDLPAVFLGGGNPGGLWGDGLLGRELPVSGITRTAMLQMIHDGIGGPDGKMELCQGFELLISRVFVVHMHGQAIREPFL